MNTLGLKQPLVVLAIAVAVTVAVWEPVSAQQAAVQYVHDELGRLVAVIDQQGNAAVYTYDAVGNLLAIQRVNAADIPGPVAITLVTPNRGRVGTEVEIFGKGFSPTASQNTVAFNGTAATVTEASPNRIATIVPSGATTGLISVTAPLGAATSPSPFTVGGVIAVSPASVAVPGTASQQFQATEDGTPTVDVTWAVNGITGGDATIGTISAGGLYTAPSTAVSPIMVTATHMADRQASGSASVTVLAQSPFFSAVSVAIAAPAPGQTIIQDVGSAVSVRVAESSVRLVAGAVAATVAPAITARSPASGAPGTNFTLTVTGSAFVEASGLNFLLPSGPDSNISVTSLEINAEGTEAIAQISIASGAAVGDRVLQITTPGGASTVGGTGGNLFTVQ